MKNLFKSLAAFQQEVPVIHKGTQGYGYSYADLPAIFEKINPLLKKHVLGFMQPINGSTIKTIVFHVESGEYIESEISIPENVELKGMNDFQVLGSAITYLRRYALSSLLGLVTDKDTDASGQQITTPVTKPNIQKVSEPTQWLNEGSEQFEAIMKLVTEGTPVTLTQVRKKYKVSKEVAEKLTKIGVQ